MSLARLRHLCKSLQRSITSNGLWTYQPKVLLISHSRAVRKEGQGRGHGNSKLSWDQKVLVRALCGLLCGLVQDDLPPSGHFLGFTSSLFTLCAVAACPLGCGQDGSHRVRVFRPWRIRSLPSGLWPRWPVRHSNQNTTFDHEHGAPDRDFSYPSRSKHNFEPRTSLAPMQIVAALNHLERTMERSLQPKVLLISHSQAVRKEGQGRGHGNSELIWDQREALCAVAACPLGCDLDGSRRVRPWCGRSLPSGLWPRWPVRHLCPSCVAQSRQADP